MSTLQDIINKYEKKGHKVDGLMIQEVQRLTDEEILTILLDANGRDIVIKEPVSDEVLD